ncbi:MULTISPECIES: tellurium resistance protein [unclassified Streptomyces]|uniref:Tellurium resistance protein n=1 Tax=Streptomyces johnsoniae TaxID=3075532 RepID=A0ABU2S4R9_9ACTN|nr:MULTISPECIES: tellurium resistance protein [unclassified Streptomyces]MDT0443983.1 tellurium resistance protein [Streptomyces sp. DSM 41886]
MASRPLHFIWLLDCSGSMGINGKITQLNYAIREAIPEMRKAADDNPGAELLVRAVTFSSGASWHLAAPTAIQDFTWEDVYAHSTTDLGAALRLTSEALKTPPMPGRALRPVLALVSDGLPTDDWRSGLRDIDATPWGKRAVRVAIGIGEDADREMLKEFLANPEQEPLRVKNPKQLVAAIRWASTVAVATASTPAVEGDKQLATPMDRTPTITAGASDDDVW